jgi:hypothetical protein
VTSTPVLLIQELWPIKFPSKLVKLAYLSVWHTKFVVEHPCHLKISIFTWIFKISLKLIICNNRKAKKFVKLIKSLRKFGKKI